MAQKIKNIIFFCTLSIVACLIAGCSAKPDLQNRNLYIKGIKRADLGSLQCTGVKILETYPNESVCSGKITNANLYICENIENGDTLCVFEACSKIPDFAKEKLYENFCIMKENVRKDVPEIVVISVPKSFKMPSNLKYVFSNLTRLID